MLKPIKINLSDALKRLRISCKLPLVLQETVRHQIIHNTAQAEGIVVSDLELQQAADDFRVRYNLYNPATTWEWLKTNHLTGDDFEQLICESIITSKLIKHLFEQQVEPYYYEHLLDYTQAVLYEIVFDDFDRAIEQFYAIEERETTFAEIARQYIQQPNLRRQYGYLGLRSRTSLNSAISAAVFASNPPQLLKPVIVDKNAHLLLVEEIIEPQLDEPLRNKILHQLFSDWLEKNLQQYSIELEGEHPTFAVSQNA